MLPDEYRGYNPSTPTRNSTSEHFFPCSSQSYPSRCQTITPSHHITARGNKATRVEASHTLPTPRSSLDSPKNLPSSDVQGPKAILPPHLTVDWNNLVSLKDVDDHAIISLPTPRQSLDSSVKQPLSFDSVLSRLMPPLDGTAQMNGDSSVKQPLSFDSVLCRYWMGQLRWMESTK